MRGLSKKYDIIFLRNALIYFTSRNRFVAMNNLVESLFDNGVLFLGVSETSAVKHPLLASRCISDVFFFQKISFQKVNYIETLPSLTSDQLEIVEQKKGSAFPVVKERHTKDGQPESIQSKSVISKSYNTKQEKLKIDCGEIKQILETEEGQPNVIKILEVFSNRINITGPDNTEDDAEVSALSSSELAASVSCFLNAQNFISADFVLSHLEKYNTDATVMFLRGEYHLQRGNINEAKKYYEYTVGKDRTFWPAFYRIASLAAEGNLTQYKYKLKKAFESLKLGKELHYECFMGGFSPDYFERILQRKLN
jgi:chemotaxis protein methyltransferase CheR